MKNYVIISFVLLVLAGFSFAGSCPAGAGTCILCGGVNGTPCDQNCPSGPNRPGLGPVACECPQGGSCTCYCPYGGGAAVTGSGQVGPPQGASLHLFEGEVEVRTPGGQWAQVTQSVPLGTGYEVRTGPSGRASIYLDDGSKLFLDPDTTLDMKLLEPRSASTLDVILELVKGALFSDVTKRDGMKFELDTTVSVFGVKGTKFSSYYDPTTKESTVKVVDGTVSVSDKLGHAVDVGAGKMVSVTEAGIGQAQAFDENAELAKWSTTGAGSGCGSAFILMVPLLGMAALSKKR